MEIVEAKIKDRYLTKLIWKALRAGYLEEEAETIQHSIAGTPQGSIITPILANVYLDQLDRYVEALAKGQAARPQPRLKKKTDILVPAGPYPYQDRHR